MEAGIQMIIENLANKLVEYQVEHPFKVFAALLALTAVIVPGATQMEIKPSTEAVLPQDDPVVESLDTLRSKFYGDTSYIVLNSGDVRNQELMESMLRIGKRIERLENVRSVRSPATMLERRYGEIPDDRDRLESFNYRGFVSETAGTAIMAVRADTQANSDEIQKLHSQMSGIIDSAAPPAKVTLTGYNMIDLATFKVIINDFIRITAVSFLAVLGVLYASFRDVKKIWLPLTVVMFALVWMIGLGGWLGADLTIISMVSAAMIMGLGIDFGIHVTKKYYSSERGVDGLSVTMVELSRGLLGASLTTAVGFLALLFANLTGMHSLGIFLFTGIISAYIGSVVLLPTIIYVYDAK
ncbi:MAG: MMPL family transporter [Candidatus Nanohaloarchaea archaeon]